MPVLARDTPPRPRRVYSEVSVAPEQMGFALRLDGRAAHTPGGAPLVVPTASIAEMVAGEWRDQAQVVEFDRMPATRMAFTAIDTDEAGRTQMADEVARYAGSDLLCYFADGPATLLEQQVAHWAPVLDWAEATLGLQLVRATGVIHRPQPAEAIARVRALALALDRFALAGLVAAVRLYGSAVLGFAVQRAMLSGEAAFELSRLDEAYQEARWGVDAEAAARTAGLRTEAGVLGRWLGLLGGEATTPVDER